MKSSLAFGLPAVLLVLCGLPAGAQVGSQGALGGRSATAGQSRPLGGIAARGSGGGGRRRSGSSVYATGPVYAAPYAYSFYTPNYFDTYGGYGTDPYAYGYQAAPPPPDMSVPPPMPMAPQAPPVIINQYFAGPPPQQGPPPDPQQDQASGDPLGPVDNFYLIAYKNHTVYTALAYWVEDKTLHYVTTGNTHNQASLDLIDMDLTKKLNQSRGVTFSLTPKQ